MRTLADDGKRWVSEKKTTPEEILRVTGSVDVE
jgi:type II secretory ATPase GspE/PulE/Tfp pilus assembly ATPase PilB-like protein